VGPACLQQLAAQLLEVCHNPMQPGFNHYLFESLAALVRWVGAGERVTAGSQTGG
jgi:exportin-2 (importin alpha re-exporter)